MITAALTFSPDLCHTERLDVWTRHLGLELWEESVADQVVKGCLCVFVNLEVEEGKGRECVCSGGVCKMSSGVGA